MTDAIASSEVAEIRNNRKQCHISQHPFIDTDCPRPDVGAVGADGARPSGKNLEWRNSG